VADIDNILYNGVETTMLDFISPFTFLFRDKAWLKKFSLASLLTYTLIGAGPVTGWLVEVARRVGQSEPSPIPAWQEWKPFWKQGAQFLAANLLWLLPLVAAVVLLYAPLLLVNHLEDVTLLVVWGGTLLCVLLFTLVYSVIYIFILPAMLVQLARTRHIGASASPLALWRAIRPHFFEYLLVFLILGLGVMNLSFLLAVLTLFLLLPPILVYVGLVTSHFAGQLSRLGS
jgi:hypothetical protein